MVRSNMSISLSKQFSNQIGIGVEMNSNKYLVLEFPCCSFWYNLATIQGDCLASRDFFTEKQPPSCSFNTRNLHFKSWQAGADLYFRGWPINGVKTTCSRGKTMCTGSEKRTGGRISRIVSNRNLKFSSISNSKFHQNQNTTESYE